MVVMTDLSLGRLLRVYVIPLATRPWLMSNRHDVIAERTLSAAPVFGDNCPSSVCSYIVTATTASVSAWQSPLNLSVLRHLFHLVFPPLGQKTVISD